MMKKRLRNSAVYVLLAVLATGVSATDGAAGKNHEKLFPEIDGWEKPAGVDVYTPETLWDIINGAADVFMAYDFRELYWSEYINSGDDGIYIVMEVYRQGCPVNAYGVYSQERPRPPKLIDVGVQGYTAPGVLHFFVADSYVKIRSHDRSAETAEVMEQLARHVSSTLDPDPRFPDIVTMLPDEGKVEFSDEYINTNFLGHPFLSGAFVSTYEIGGNRFNLFAIEHENRDKSRQMLAEYYKFSRQDTDLITEGIHRIDDRWNGEVGIVWKGNVLYGYYNLEDEKLQEKYLELFSGI